MLKNINKINSNDEKNKLQNQNIEEALIDIYLSLKIRKQEEVI